MDVPGGYQVSDCMSPVRLQSRVYVIDPLTPGQMDRDDRVCFGMVSEVLVDVGLGDSLSFCDDFD